jgi:hypothetical protein
MIRVMKHFVIHVCFAVLLVVFLPQIVIAREIDVSPVLLDLELATRDISTHDVTITNPSDGKVYVYVTVNEISVDDAGARKEFITPSMDTRESSITSWVEITRGRIELDPGQTKTIPLTIKVHPYANEGTYHAFIGFIKEANRPAAEAKAMRGEGEGVLLKVALEEAGSESLRITSFTSKRFIVDDAERTLSLELKNEGTRTVTPTGEVVFYNSRGEEVNATAVNPTAQEFLSGETRTLQIDIPSIDTVGRFKANVTVRYGEENGQSVFDTTQFYLIPFMYMIITILAIVLLSGVITYLLRKMFYDELPEDDEDGKQVPLFVKGRRDHVAKDHDIHIQKR